MSPENRTSITFSNSSDYGLWFQAYCLNPPRDSCEFGPCPNPDVVGIGQKVSLYISSMGLGIILIYSPKDFETTAFAYLANVYALLISALISALNSNLTQNDGVFVLVAVASPATLYLWACIFFKLVLFRRLPSWQAYGISTKIYKFSLQLIVIGSLILWITMVIIIVASPRGISLSQPACNKQFGLRGWITLIWPLPYLIQLLVLIIGLDLPLPPFFGHRIFLTTQPSLLQWTNDSLTQHGTIGNKFPISRFWLLFTLQVHFSFSETLLPGKLQIITSFILPPVLCYWILVNYRIAKRPRRRIFIDILLAAATCLVRLVLPFFLGPFLLLFNVLLISIIIVPVWLVHGRNVSRSPGSNRYPAKTLGALLLWCLCLSGINILPVCLGTQSLKAIPHLNRTGGDPVALGILNLCFWAIPWAQATILKPETPLSWLEKQNKNWSNIVEMFESAQILKFGFLYVTPTVAWICATVSSDGTESFVLTFGQIFSIIVSIVPFCTVFSVCRRNIGSIRDEVFKPYSPVVILTPPQPTDHHFILLEPEENTSRMQSIETELLSTMPSKTTSQSLQLPDPEENSRPILGDRYPPLPEMPNRIPKHMLSTFLQYSNRQ